MPTLKYRDPADGLWKPVDGFVQPHPQGMIAASADLSLTTAVVTTAALDTVVYDTGGVCDAPWSQASRRLFATLSGYWRITARSTFASNATGYRAHIVRKNGTNGNSGGTLIHDFYTQAANGQVTVMTSTSEPIWMDAGDYITMNVIQTSGGALIQGLSNSRYSSLAMEYTGLVGPQGVSGATVSSLQATTDVAVAGRSLGRGVVGYDEMDAGTTLTSASATMVDSSMTTTVVAPAGRLYKITGQLHPRSSVANDRCLMTIVDGAAQIQINQGPHLVTAASGYTQQVVAMVAPSAGSHTYKVQFSRFSGTGTITVSAAATAPSFLLVEDLGPA